MNKIKGQQRPNKANGGFNFTHDEHGCGCFALGPLEVPLLRWVEKKEHEVNRNTMEYGKKWPGRAGPG
jgi:hypothetical protein